MAKVEFLLKSKLEQITISELKILKEEYFNLLELNKFPKPPISGNAVEMIHYFKRKDEINPISIGPYKNITPFEAANRIASDLVIINGLLKLVEENKIENALFTLLLGTTHIKEKGDFTIKKGDNEWEGEAFNVATSFLNAKLQKTKSKWKDNPKLKYILINAEAFEGVIFKSLDERVFKVKNWET